MFIDIFPMSLASTGTIKACKSAEIGSLVFLVTGCLQFDISGIYTCVSKQYSRAYTVQFMTFCIVAYAIGTYFIPEDWPA